MSKSQMLLNYVPGEECRVAIVEDGKLEELHVERFAQASRVGNIYLGKVNNVEPSIQAAFVDFGVGENGFLHVSDLHPRYFPGVTDDDSVEKVGHKTPRRERPAMQEALKRNNEILVQVLKEGVGTKGPTLTSYLSIPGRFLVMMPFMDNVGVSRKVEDEDQRRKMREILDQLDLPEGFGFILRTAGMDRTKAELKRDLAYLMRLWKDMERRLSGGSGRTRLLYSESDLLVRALRDMVSAETDEVIVDNEAALQRAARFLKIVAPRSTCKLYHYKEKSPMFHAFGVEEQISLMHAREVPLPSGGRLVIDQTEAMVAIDVNSGKSRDARDSEDNAFQTNLEAVDEICRQLRLRDMGGIVCNDLIDMRFPSNRKDVEARFKERLKRDRAKTTIATISPFGILEMTRQRMRGSHETVHFADCPTCRGRGILQKPDSVAADALRDLSALLANEKVRKVEMVVAPRVASELLSHKRQMLSRIERAMDKHVDVRVSETVPVDRVTVYAYDDEGDLDLTKMPRPVKPRNLEEFAYADLDENDEKFTFEEPETQPLAEDEDIVERADHKAHPIELDEVPLDGEGHVEEVQGPTLADIGRRDRRGRASRGRDGDRGRDRGPARGRDTAPQGRRDSRGGGRRDARPAPAPPVRAEVDEWGEAPAAPAPLKGVTASTPPGSKPPAVDAGGEQGEGGSRRRRRRRGRGGRGGADSFAEPQGVPPQHEPISGVDGDIGIAVDDIRSPFEVTPSSPFGIPEGFSGFEETGHGGNRRGGRRSGSAPAHAGSNTPRQGDTQNRAGQTSAPQPRQNPPAKSVRPLPPLPPAQPVSQPISPRGGEVRGGFAPHGANANGAPENRPGRDRARFVRPAHGTPGGSRSSASDFKTGGDWGDESPETDAPRPMPPLPGLPPMGSVPITPPAPPAERPAPVVSHNPITPPPIPASVPPAPTQKPRTLYGAARRKLNPSEINKRPKQE